MLILNPEYRYTCEELLSHEYFSEEPTMDSSEFKGIINETHEFHIRKNNMENAQNQQIANNSYKNSNNNGSSSFLGIKRDKSNSIVNE
jgi:serine/threonine protein kinase